MKQIGIKFLLLLCLGVTLGGCQKVEEKPVLTYEEVQQEMLDYLEHKYNEEFEVHSMDYKSWYNGYIETMLAYPRGGNENYNFYVKRTKEGITDEYVIFTMTKIYDKKVQEIVKKYFPEAVVHTGLPNSDPVPDSFRPNMDLSAFKKYADKVVTLGVTIYMVAETEADINLEKVQLLIQELKTLNDVGGITFIGYSEEGFEDSVLNDSSNSKERNQSYSSNGETIVEDVFWGQIDFDYEYMEDNNDNTH